MKLFHSLLQSARTWTRATWIALAVLTLIAGAIAQDVVGNMLPYNRKIAAVPSRVAQVRGKQIVYRANHQQAKTKQRRRHRRDTKRQSNRHWLKTHHGKHPGGSRSHGGRSPKPTPRPTPKKGGHTPVPKPPKKPPVPARTPSPPPATSQTRQAITFAFLNPRRQPVGGLAVTATIHDENGGARTISNLRTNAQGKVRIADLALPVSVDVDSDDANWQIADVEAASLLVENPTGSPRVAMSATTNAFCAPAKTASHTAATSPACNKIKRKPPKSKAPPRTRVYEATPQIVGVERTVVDLQLRAPAGSQVSTPALPDQNLQVPADGTLEMHLPAAALGEGAVPIRLSKTLPGGESETVVENYGTDPYQTNVVQAPPLQLVTLNAVSVSSGVTSGGDVIKAKYGDLGGKDNKKNQIGKINPQPDGSQWWLYPSRGLAFKMRPLPSASDGDIKKNRAPMLAERVHFEAPAPETVGGIGIGSTLEEVRAKLGEPEGEPATATSVGKYEEFLQKGLRIYYLNGKVNLIELARPTELLQSGTTAFVPRRPAKLYIENFVGNPQLSLSDPRSFANFVSQSASVQLVDNRDDADLILRARVSEFVSDKDKFADLFAYRYDCRTALTYSLFDVAANRFVYDQKQSVGTAKVDYTKEAALIGIAGGLLRKKLGNLSLLIAGFGIAELNEGIRKAANRSPAIATRTAFAGMMRDIDNASDFSARVTGVDYARGTLTINAGTRDGVRVSTPDHPFEWQINLGDQSLPDEESPRRADFYVARVISADQNSCVCELRHRVRSTKKAKDKESDEAAPEMLRRLPDPATGLLEARASVRFPDLNIISEDEVRRANANAERQSANLPEEAPGNNANNQGPNPTPGDGDENEAPHKKPNLLQGVLGALGQQLLK